MSDEIRPALTPDEWRARKLHRDSELVSVRARAYGSLDIHDRLSGGGVVVPGSIAHALAALALHGQPFGFTHETLEAMKRAANFFADMEDGHWRYLAADLRREAAKIAALLPPEP